MERQWSNKPERHVAQARRVVMANGLAGARREELKDRQFLSLHAERRSDDLNGSGMNKIVRSSSATPHSIRIDGHARTYDMELTDISHWEQCLYDRISNRRASCD